MLHLLRYVPIPKRPENHVDKLKRRWNSLTKRILEAEKLPINLRQFHPKVETMERQRNALNVEILSAQQACTHEFILLEQLTDRHFRTSIVPSVFVAGNRNTNGVIFFASRMTFCCLLCSVERDGSIATLCPLCCSDMMKGSLYSRVKYLGEEYQYFASRRYDCTQCTFACVKDEWNEDFVRSATQ